MGILSRFKDIMASNINALLDKCEDPSKMIDQHLRNAREDLAKVKTETAAVMAEETRARRVLAANADAQLRYESMAAQAVAAGEEADALRFLEEDAKLESEAVGLQQTLDLAVSNATKMRELYNKLTADVQLLDSRRASMKAKVAVASTQERVNALGANASKAGAVMGKFQDLEARVDERLDKAMAAADLDRQADGGLGALESKYTTGGASAAEKLAALKAKMAEGQ